MNYNLDSGTVSALDTFNLLLEQIDAEVARVNLAGSAAMQAARYDDAGTAIAKARELLALRDKLITLRQEWESLVPAPQAVPSPSKAPEELSSKRRNLGRAARGEPTPRTAYYRPILEALVHLGGSAPGKDVVDHVFITMKPHLQEIDYEHLPSDNEFRWRKSALWARYSLVQAGFINSNSRHGIWEISDEGRRYLSASMSQPARLAGVQSEGSTPKKRNLGRAVRGSSLSQTSYYRPILEALASMGGAGRVGAVLERVEVALRSSFKPADLEPKRSRPDELRWYNNAQWARNAMISKGLLRAGSPHGTWEISDEGRRYLNQPSPIPRAIPVAPSVVPPRSRPQRQSPSRLGRGLRTPEHAYFQPILEALVKLDGSAEVNDILERVERSMRSTLTTVDYEPIASDNTIPRWRNTAQWARNAMVKQGLLKPSAQRGVWEISRKGRDSIHAQLPPERGIVAKPAPQPPKPTSSASQSLRPPSPPAASNTPASSTQPGQFPTQLQLTPQSAYYKPLLRALASLGGSAPRADVRAHVEVQMKDIFNSADLTGHPNNPHLPFWRAVFYRAAESLFKQGLLANGATSNDWKITDTGRRHLA